ncbi:Envelope glycoprotein like [Heracleum sosnowskyi]|uniref:Envelope glycoprotein like n=1 Tax=Heracleum sosnowskyi TaxID=360622 RepID=A0AAD8MXX0_9APIA|nr:Envelope glycoprotein like [Heracleum sosnowskyi]
MDDCHDRCVFPLSNLQIGDLQSYLSDLSLFLALESKKFYILVDNRPWVKDLVSRPAHLWQLMVTKSRLSPFANTRKQKEEKETRGLFDAKASKLKPSKSRKFKRWFNVINASALSTKRVLVPVKNLRTSLIFNSRLHRTLYGFIVFEVAWSDVRGINYFNELQTDTYLAIESKFMKKWEFDSIAQAVGCISSWFSGTLVEKVWLKEHLDSAVGDVFYDAEDSLPPTTYVDNDEQVSSIWTPVNVDNNKDISSSSCSGFGVYSATAENLSDVLPHSPTSQNGPYKRRKLIKSFSAGFEVEIYSEETHSEASDSPVQPQTPYASDSEEALKDTQYRDVLLLFRFNDRDLPFKLRDIITSDLRLLTLLECGLPSWVIFLQSYPVFCHFYRPWMCPLARTLYVLISVVTVLIGFYDLYKNVPILKAALSRFCGPLLDWIDTWEMVSRMKYLGTMLFLHNSQKALEWFMTTMRTIKSFFRILTQPVAGPIAVCWQLIVPLWDTFMIIARNVGTLIWVVVDSSADVLEIFAETVLFPLWCTLSFIWKFATSIFWILWNILYTPFSFLQGISNVLVVVFMNAYELVKDICLFMSSIFRFASSADVTVNSYEVSMWRTLSKDLFSQVFRAVRSILNGLVAFFVACNRHRLSIYNHIIEFFQRLSRTSVRIQLTDQGPRIQLRETPKMLKETVENSHRMKDKKQR